MASAASRAERPPSVSTPEIWPLLPTDLAKDVSLVKLTVPVSSTRGHEHWHAFAMRSILLHAGVSGQTVDSDSASWADQAGRRNVTRSCQCGGGRIQACWRSERWRVFGRGCTEEVWRCAGRFERVVILVLLLRDDREPRLDLPCRRPDPALFVNFLDFAGLTVCCRNAAIRLRWEHVWMYGRCPRCKRNLTISEAFGCGHVFGLLSLGGLPLSRCSRYGRWP